MKDLSWWIHETSELLHKGCITDDVEENIWVRYDDNKNGIVISYEDGLHLSPHMIVFSPQDILKILKLIPTKEIE